MSVSMGMPLARTFFTVLVLSCASTAQRAEPDEYITSNPENPNVPAHEHFSRQESILAGGLDGRDDMVCYVLNTAAERMAPQGFGGQAPRPWASFGFHAHGILEVQIALSPSAALYRPLARFPKNDGCAYQAEFGGQPPSGCNITGVDVHPIPAGGFRFPPPSKNQSHCQRFGSCIDKDVWTSDPRHMQDIGAQGQWCSEIGGCWQPATGIRTNNGCKCYSDRPLADWYGPNVAEEEIPPKVDGNRALACTTGWVRLLGGTRCGYYGYGTEGQHPTGPVIRDRGEGKVDNPALAAQKRSNVHSEAREQDSASFVFRRHPSCLRWSYINETIPSNSSNSSCLNASDTSCDSTLNTTMPNVTNINISHITDFTPVANVSDTFQDTPAPFVPAPKVDAGSIGQRDTCDQAGQVQLAAMTISDSGEPLIHEFASLLNHSVVVTLRITFEERRAAFELLASDGVTLLERHTLSTRFCHNYRLGRNLGLSRLPLVNETEIDSRCALVTPMQACYSSDPALWGTPLWRRNAAAAADAMSGEPRKLSHRRPEPRCQPPFCV